MKPQLFRFLYDPWTYTIGGGLAILVIWASLKGWLGPKVKAGIDNIARGLSKAATAIKRQVSKVNREILDFVVKEQEDNDQGCYGKRLDITSDNRIRTLNFTVESNDNFWRAGFKIFSPNGNFQQLADVREGILFHLAFPHSQKNKIFVLTLFSL